MPEFHERQDEHEAWKADMQALIEGQRRSHEMHIQCYHLRADCGLVLRTQTIFELKDGSAED